MEEKEEKEGKEEKEERRKEKRNDHIETNMIWCDMKACSERVSVLVWLWERVCVTVSTI